VGEASASGVDEVSLGLVADAWSRTYRSRAVTFAGTAGARQTRNGIRILPDQVATGWPADRLVPAIAGRPPAEALDQALHEIAAGYEGAQPTSSPCNTNTQGKGAAMKMLGRAMRQVPKSSRS